MPQAKQYPMSIPSQSPASLRGQLVRTGGPSLQNPCTITAVSQDDQPAEHKTKQAPRSEASITKGDASKRPEGDLLVDPGKALRMLPKHFKGKGRLLFVLHPGDRPVSSDCRASRGTKSNAWQHAVKHIALQSPCLNRGLL